jgi:hypothetical protein
MRVGMLAKIMLEGAQGKVMEYALAMSVWPFVSAFQCYCLRRIIIG